MKILYVDPMSRNNLGVYDKNLLQNISNNQIYFFCNKDFQYNFVKNVVIVREYDYNKKKNLLKILSYLKSQYKLYLFVKIHKISIIHFQWFKIPILDIILIRIFKLMGIKIVLTAHNLVPHDSGKKYYEIFNNIYNAVDRIIVHTEITKLELINIFSIDKNKIKVIPHGLLDNLVEKSEKKMNLRVRHVS